MLKVKVNHKKLVAMLSVNSVGWTRRLGFYHTIKVQNQYHDLWDQFKKDHKPLHVIKNATDLLDADEWDTIAYETGILVGSEREVSLTGYHSVENHTYPGEVYRIIGYNGRIRFYNQTTMTIVRQGDPAVIWLDKLGVCGILLLKYKEKVLPNMEVEATYDEDLRFTQGHLELYFLGEDAEFEEVPYMPRPLMLYGHEVQEAETLLKGFDNSRNGKYAIAYLPHPTRIVHSHHEPIEAGKGWWLFWHPRPSRTID